jgi:hypothetical protein
VVLLGARATTKRGWSEFGPGIQLPKLKSETTRSHGLLHVRTPLRVARPNDAAVEQTVAATPAIEGARGSGGGLAVGNGEAVRQGGRGVASTMGSQSAVGGVGGAPGARGGEEAMNDSNLEVTVGL